MELKSRKDMDPRYMWDLSHIFRDRAAFEAAMKEASGLIDAAARFSGSLGESSGRLKAGLDAMAAARQKTELCYIYGMLHKAADGGEPEHQAMQSSALNLYIRLNSDLAFSSRCCFPSRPKSWTPG
jgi:oligoendopeptidase F